MSIMLIVYSKLFQIALIFDHFSLLLLPTAWLSINSGKHSGFLLHGYPLIVVKIWNVAWDLLMLAMAKKSCVLNSMNPKQSMCVWLCIVWLFSIYLIYQPSHCVSFIYHLG